MHASSFADHKLIDLPFKHVNEKHKAYVPALIDAVINAGSSYAFAASIVKPPEVRCAHGVT